MTYSYFIRNTRQVLYAKIDIMMSECADALCYHVFTLEAFC